MNRRRFMSTVSAFAAAGFATSRWAKEPTRPLWSVGFRTPPRANLMADLTITGDIPKNLRGTLYRNGPAQHDVGDLRYRHWFDGDGMVQAFRIDEGGIHHRGRFVETHKYLAERKAGRALYSGFDTHVEDGAPVNRPDDVNSANISVLYHQDRLMALWEAGSAYELDPDTLATIGPVEWSKETSGMPFSAHPRVEADGTIWNIGYLSSANKLALWHITPQGTLANVAIVELDHTPMVHDFVVTEKHVVVLLCPWHYESGAGMTFLESHVWHPERPTRVLVVDKNDFGTRQFLETDPGWVFHFGNAFEHNGVIRLDAAISADPLDVSTTFRDYMRGEQPASQSPPIPTELTIDLEKKRITTQPILDRGVSGEFPVVDPRLIGRPYQELLLLTEDTTEPPAHPTFNAVTRVNLSSGRHDSYVYEPHVMPEEHIFVPDPSVDDESKGWVLGTSLDFRAERTRLAIFDAGRLSNGPRALAELPYMIPLGLHGKFAA